MPGLCIYPFHPFSNFHSQSVTAVLPRPSLYLTLWLSPSLCDSVTSLSFAHQSIGGIQWGKVSQTDWINTTIPPTFHWPWLCFWYFLTSQRSLDALLLFVASFLLCYLSYVCHLTSCGGFKVSPTSGWCLLLCLLKWPVPSSTSTGLKHEPV